MTTDKLVREFFDSQEDSDCKNFHSYEERVKHGGSGILISYTFDGDNELMFDFFSILDYVTFVFNKLKK